MSTVPDFYSADFLRQHIKQTMAFYHPHCLDARGGCFHYFRDDGTLYRHNHRHLVSSTRFVFNYAMYTRYFGGHEYREGLYHCLAYLRNTHHSRANGGYIWTLMDGQAEDTDNHAYGLAFVLLAYASAYQAGVNEAYTWLNETWDLLERHFWDSHHELYRDQANANWHFSSYRGQNANMHLCEAFLAAYNATGEARYLQRALTLANHITRRQAAKAGGLIWEHYDQNWDVDWAFNRDKPDDLFKPWGFQPGHQIEWAKLLLILARHHHADWLLTTAQYLFDTALLRARDHKHGGIYYGTAPDKSICNADKYHWVQAETLACAALLAERTGDNRYWHWYERLWRYVWQHFVDHKHGGWYRIVDRQGNRYNDEKSPAGKTDYHNMGACYELLNVIK